MRSHYKHLLFDADNTLFDFNAAEHNAFLALSDIDSTVFCENNYGLYHKINDIMWKRLEKQEITKDELKKLRFYDLYKALSLSVNDTTLDTIVKAYPKNLALGTILIPGALEIIKKLHTYYGIYIITNGIYEVQTTRLSTSALFPYIDNVFISEKLGYEKPAKEFFDCVLDSEGDYDKENYIVIGDSLSSDIDGAIASGIDCIYFDPKNCGAKGRAPNYIINSLYEIDNIL